MPWPSLSDYTQAVGNHPHISILDLKLKGGTPKRGKDLFSITSYAGGFSIVFPIEVVSSTFALRCWIKDIGDAETRYKEISDYLKQYGLPYFVDFAYVPEGILVNGVKYPITRMEWAEGETLCDFIKQNLQDARCLKTAAAEFQKMVAALHTHQISHGDLQDGNILLERNGTDVNIKLIDYDSLFVPALRGQPDSIIVGLPEYQHPQRIAGGGGANEKVDYFSELVIYLSILSLAEKPDLWSQFGDRTERGLLFTVEDFKNPDQSDVLRELENLSPDVKQLASKLKEFCNLSIDQLEPLEAVLPRTSPAQALYNQGLAYLHSNRYNEAVVEFEKGIGLDPNYKEAYHGLGLAHLKMGDSGEAKRAAEAALRIDSHYQPAHQLLDAIKSFKPPPPPPPPPGGSGQASTKGWQYITGALAFILLICIVALAIQIDAKDEVLHRIAMLTNQQVETDSELDAANSSIRTLSNGKTRLLRENQKLRNEQVETDSELDAANSSIRTLSNGKTRLLRENQKLRNELTEQDEETKTQIVIAKQLRSEKEELHNRNQELRNENSMLRNQSKLDATNSSIRTLSNEKARLLRENQKLQNQLTEKNRETRTQMAIVQQLRSEKEEFLSQKRKLQNENARLREQLDKRRPPRDPPEQFRAAPLQKISSNSRPRVRKAAMSKNNQGYFAFESRYKKAVGYFEEARKSDSQSAVVYYNLGSTYLEIKEYTKSVNYLREAVNLDPKFKEAYYNLALAYLRWGYRQEAKKAAQIALNIDRNYQPARQLLAAIE